MYKTQQAFNVAYYRVQTSVFVAAYQQAPSLGTPYTNPETNPCSIVIPNQYREAYCMYQINDDMYQFQS